VIGNPLGFAFEWIIARSHAKFRCGCLSHRDCVRSEMEREGSSKRAATDCGLGRPGRLRSAALKLCLPRAGPGSQIIRMRWHHAASLSGLRHRSITCSHWIRAATSSGYIRAVLFPRLGAVVRGLGAEVLEDG
jgi:hypothetical protein